MALDLRVRCHSLLFGPVRGIAVFYCCNFKLYKLRPLILRSFYRDNASCEVI